jgi:hypothetical protein
MPQSPQVWLRFAQVSPSAACDGEKLGSFCTIYRGTPTGCPRLGLFCAFTLRPGQIGFVLRILPPAPVRRPHLSIRNLQSAIRGGSRPTNWLCLPVRKTAHNSHNPFTTNDFARIPAGANWLCSASFLSRPPPEGPGLRVPAARMSLRGPTRSGATRRGRRSNLNGGSWGCALPTMADPSNMLFVACCLRFKARCSVVTAIQ